MSLFIPAFPLIQGLDEGADVFDPPHGSAGTELYGLGIAPGAAPLPPRAFADGEDGKNLGQTQKTKGGDGWLIREHKKTSCMWLDFRRLYLVGIVNVLEGSWNHVVKKL